MTSGVEVSVVLGTYNRADLLPGALTSILAQTARADFELIVVDNNSPDNTAEVVRSFAASDPRVKYLFEPKQGVSYARNAGIAIAQADLIAFTDDDVRADPDWMERFLKAMKEHPEIGYVGGKVLPIWPQEPPPWLTQDHWYPLALVDYGDEPFLIPTDFRRVIVSANLVFRRSVLLALGGFDPALQRVKDGIGSMEDHELQQRFWDRGGVGMYDPRIVIRAAVQLNRFDKDYHRRWHKGYGKFTAMAGDDVWEQSSAKLLGVPRGRYREAASRLARWVGNTCLMKQDEAFRHEIQFIYGSSFISHRIGQRFRKTSE